MKIKIFQTLIFSLLTSLAGYGQTAMQELVGSLVLEDGQSYAYHLIYTDSAGIVKGTTISDKGGKSETKASVTGTYNAKKNTLSFTERKVLSSKYKTTEFCLLQFSGKITEKGGMKVISGKATGYLNGDQNKPCGKGRVTFTTKDDIFALSKRLLTLLDTSKLNDSLKTQVLQLQEKVEAEGPKVTNHSISNRSGASLHWYSDTLKLQIFDDGEIDYDVITVSMDGKPLLKNVSLTKEPVRTSVVVPQGTHKLTFHAEHEGSVPPNTAKAILYDGEIQHIINCSTSYGKDAAITITR